MLRRLSDQFELCAFGLSRVRREWEKIRNGRYRLAPVEIGPDVGLNRPCLDSPRGCLMTRGSIRTPNSPGSRSVRFQAHPRTMTQVVGERPSVPDAGLGPERTSVLPHVPECPIMVLPLGDLHRTQIVPYVTYALIAINVAVFLVQQQKGTSSRSRSRRPPMRSAQRRPRPARAQDPAVVRCRVRVIRSAAGHPASRAAPGRRSARSLSDPGPAGPC